MRYLRLAGWTALVMMGFIVILALATNGPRHTTHEFYSRQR